MAKQPPSPILIAILLLAFLGLGIWAWLHWFKSEPAPPEITPPAPVEPAAEAQPPAPTPPSLPPLDTSDETVRSLVTQLSNHPELATWLVSGDLARRFVAAVDNVARGESPRVHFGFLDPERPFETTYRDGDLIIDPVSFERYDPIVEVFTTVDAEQAVAIYRRMKPLFDEAYRELGYPDAEFDRTLKRALNRLIAVPIPDGPIELDQRVTSYRFADPALENAAAAAKHLLRLGPSNARRLQGRFKAFLEAWERPAADPAPGAEANP